MGVAVEMNVRKLPGPMDAPPLLRTVIQRWIPQSELRGSSWDTAYSTAGHTLYLAMGHFWSSCRATSRPPYTPARTELLCGSTRKCRRQSLLRTWPGLPRAGARGAGG